jgi:hypothetical protein
VRVRATAKRSGGHNVALVALLKLELPPHQADDGQGNEQQEPNVVYFCVVRTHPNCVPCVLCVVCVSCVSCVCVRACYFDALPSHTGVRQWLEHAFGVPRSGSAGEPIFDAHRGSYDRRVQPSDSRCDTVRSPLVFAHSCWRVWRVECVPQLTVTTTGELWDTPLIVRPWFAELAAKLGVSWTPWQYRSTSPRPQFRPNSLQSACVVAWAGWRRS